MTRGRTLGRSFYARDVLTVAPDLLNKVLVHDDPVVGRLAMRIVEVEAYLGQDDPASHAYRGPTRRNATMFGPPGHLYVYFTYGMHWCANVTTGPTDAAHAVLLRAGAPVEGLDAMRARRPTSRADRDLGAGPARLTLALGLTGEHDGLDLTRGSVRILDDGTPPPSDPARSTRVGLLIGEGDLDEWRVYVAGDPHLSRNNPGRARPRKSRRGDGETRAPSGTRNGPVSTVHSRNAIRPSTSEQ